MIKFFRQIRHQLFSENKHASPASPNGSSGRVGRYLLYAIGEIFLVVIGILIAINLNNSNQQKKLNESVEAQLNILRQSVYLDSISFQGLIEYSEMQIAKSKRLIQLINGPMNKDNCEEFISLFKNHLEIRTDIADRSLYDEMVNSGAFSKIRKQELKSQIATYYQLSDHFDRIIGFYVRDFREFNNQIAIDGTIARSYLDPNSSYTAVEKCDYLISILKNIKKKQKLENFFYSGIDTYQQINRLYSVLVDRILPGLPDKSE